MTEYVIVTSVAVVVAAWLYHPDNGIYYGIRKTFAKTNLVLTLPGP